MPQFRYSSDAPDLRPMRFHAQDMAAVGQAALEAERGRIARAVNVSDLPALPLARWYRRQKARRGVRPIRDWTFSGDMLRSMTVAVQGGSATVVFALSGAKANSLAYWNARREQMAGLSPQDQASVQGVIEQRFHQKVAGYE